MNYSTTPYPLDFAIHKHYNKYQQGYIKLKKKGLHTMDNNGTTNSQGKDDELNNLTSDETIDLFIRGIMEEKGVKTPTDEIAKDIFENLRNSLLEQIDRSLIAELPDDKLEELNRMASQNGQIDPEVIAKMVQEANIDVEEVTGITMARFRDIYLGNESNKTAEE